MIGSDGQNGNSSTIRSQFNDTILPDAGPRSKLPSLSGVPSIYFDSSFDLSDPRTFATVTEQSTATTHRRTSSSPGDIALNHILQEKLSHYMDIVEQHLVQEIAIRSVPFFAALSNLQDLQTEGAACLSRIARLKAQLREVDNCQVKRGLQVVQLQTKRDNLQQLQRAVKDLREVGEMFTMAKHLEDEGDHFAALGLTETVEAFLERKEDAASLTVDPEATALPHIPRHKPQEGNTAFSLPIVIESPGTPTVSFSEQKLDRLQPQDPHTALPLLSQTTINLASLTSLSSMPSKLADLRTTISLALQRDLIGLLSEDLVNQTKGLESSTTTIPLAEAVRPEAWGAQLQVLLDGLLRTGGLERAFGSYKEAALARIRHQANARDQNNQTEKEPESTSEENVEFIKDMDHDAFMRLIRSLYSTLLKSIQTIQEHGTSIQKILKEISEYVHSYSYA